MALATYTTNLTDLYAGAGSTIGWTALGGGASGLNAETDYFIQGTGMTSKNAFASAKKGMIFDSGSDRAATIGTDGAVLIWTTHATPNSVASIANGGIDLIVGSSTSDFKHWYVGGGDTIEFMGWILAAVNPSETTSEADTGTPTAVEQFFGVLFNLPSGGPTKGAPNAIDAIRAGRCDLIYEFGTGADPNATFQLAVNDKGDVTDRLGLIQRRSGAFFLSGLHQLGSATNVVNFTDSNKTLFWNDHPSVTAPFNTLEIQNAFSVINMTNISWKALGTKTPGTWTTTDNATVNLTTCNFIDWGAFGFLGSTTVDTCAFLSCGQITHGGSNMSGSSVLTSTVAANTGALVFNEATDPDTKTDGMTFSKGTNAHHAIQFGTNVPATVTLRNCDFTGFSSLNDVDGSVFRFDDTAGNITLNLVKCTTDGAFSVDDRAGVTVLVSIDPVTTLINVKDNNGDNLQNARVFLKASDGTGNLPFEESVTIISTGTLATVAHTGHGLNTNEFVKISGITNKTADNAGAHQITVTNVNEYTYATTDTGVGYSYTGTIISTGALIHGLTNEFGNISSSRTLSFNQPLEGFVRKSSASPRFKTFPLADTVDSADGLTINVRLVLDE